jgi:hypothetical protein
MQNRSVPILLRTVFCPRITLMCFTRILKQPTLTDCLCNVEEVCLLWPKELNLNCFLSR